MTDVNRYHGYRVDDVPRPAGLYMDTEYYAQYPPGMKMTDGIPGNYLTKY